MLMVMRSTIREAASRMAAPSAPWSRERATVHAAGRWARRPAASAMRREEQHVDVAVVGGGIMGSAAAYAAASRLGEKGRVLLLEQYSLLHRRGSSHGESRICRKAYPQAYYTSMMEHGYELWERAQAKSGQCVYTPTRGLDIAHEDTEDIWSLIESVKQNNVAHSVLTPSDVASRFAGLRLPKDYVGVLVEEAGAVHATKAVMMFQQLARDEGCFIYDNESALDISPNAADDTVRIRTSKENTIVANKVIVCCGAWTRALLRSSSGIEVALNPIHTTTAYWSVTGDDARQYSAATNGGNFPCIIDYTGHDLSGDMNGIYSIPSLEYPGLIKVCHHGGPPVPDPSNRDMTPGHVELEKYVQPWIQRFMPGVDFRSYAMAEACMYTLTPTSDFLLDSLPGSYKNVVVGGGFSGHGFKFGPLIGEILSDIAIDGRHTRHDMSHFSLSKVAMQPLQSQM